MRKLYLLFGAIITLLLVSGISTAVSQSPFTLALPGYQFHFPRDHASHDTFKTEWWYYTGYLKAENGHRYGYELTFFRTNPGIIHLPQKTRWALKNVYLTHFAITDETGRKFFHHQFRNRPGYHVAGAETARYHVWNQNAQVRLVGQHHELQVNTPEFGLALRLDPAKPPVIHGQNGVSQKAGCYGCASHYYSMTRLKTQGILRQGKTPVRVTGLSWMDHEFGSNQLGSDQVGWDWFSVQLEDQTELMLYQLRLKNGQIDPHSSGTWVEASGKAHHLDRKAFRIRVLDHWKSPDTGGRYPSLWQVEIPSKKLSLRITPTYSRQELVAPENSGLSYWEGSCRVTGHLSEKPIMGRAYVEMTGYAERFRQKI